MLYSIVHINNQVPSFHKSIYSFLLHFILKKPLQFSCLLILNTVEISQSAVYGFILGRMIQKMSDFALNPIEIMNGSDYMLLIGAYFSMGIFVSICEGFRGILRARLMPWLVDQIRSHYLSYIIEHSCLYFSQNLTGDLISRTVYVVDNSISIIELVIDEFIPNFIFILISMAIFYHIHFSFSVVFFLWFICHFAFVRFRRSKYLILAQSNSRFYNNLMGMISDIFINILQVKTSNSSKFEISYFRKYQDLDIGSYRKVKLYDGITMASLDLIYSFWFCCVLVYQFISKWAAGLITTGQVIHVNQTIRVLAVHIWTTTQKIGKFLMNIAKCRDSLNAINIPHGSPDLFPMNKFINYPELDGSINFKNVSFCYQSTLEHSISVSEKHKSAYLLDDFNLFIKPGSRVAVVGSSGSGKSTIFHLVMRLIDPITGTIEVNGQDISKIGKKYLLDQFSFIPQKQLIFQRSIFENIGYGCREIRGYIARNLSKNLFFKDIEEAIRDKIVKAAKKSYAHDFIINLKNGYDSIYGVEIGFSGGQSQRIMIARAFVNEKSKFLLLDEATSALDKSTEKIIKESIDVLSKNRTVVMIAHKLNIVKDFDRILLFHKGQIIEDGTHDELMELKGKYFNLTNG